ncbi:hypothetical protein ACFQ9Z_14830 [Streptomyces sp. NPDC056580]|uniref:hypothetical protein n=1 Tax=Streptomyces sp. NPDC056580 TaxID=3345872 RepID=UPI0036B4687A
MTAPSSTPRGEHTPRPGVTWTTELVSLGEVVVDLDDRESPFGWRELPAPAGPEPRDPARRAACSTEEEVTDQTADFDGCARACRKKGKHTRSPHHGPDRPRNEPYRQRGEQHAPLLRSWEAASR